MRIGGDRRARLLDPPEALVSFPMVATASGIASLGVPFPNFQLFDQQSVYSQSIFFDPWPTGWAWS